MKTMFIACFAVASISMSAMASAGIYVKCNACNPFPPKQASVPVTQAAVTAAQQNNGVVGEDITVCKTISTVPTSPKSVQAIFFITSTPVTSGSNLQYDSVTSGYEDAICP
jgi:hypothetical protein